MHFKVSLYSFIAATLAAMSIVAAAPAWAANATDLAIRFTTASFRNGTTGLYTVTMTNNGPAATNDVVTVNLEIPAGLYLISGGGNAFTCTSGSGGVACVRETSVPSGTSTSFQVRVGVCSSFTRVSTKATVAYLGDTRSTNNTYSRGTSVRLGPCLPSPTPSPTLTSTVTRTATPVNTGPTRTFTPSPSPTPTLTPIPAVTDLKVTKTSVGSARVGQTYSYTLTAFNLGSNATNLPLTVVDTLPNGLSYASSTGTGWSCSPSAQIVTCTYFPSLAAAASSSLTFTVNVGSAAFPTVTNRALLSYAGDPDTTNNTANRPTSVRQ